MARRGCGAVVLFAAACAPDFSLTRVEPPVETVGRVLYGVVCDRVGAQSLPMDVTGTSFHGICHADPTTHAYATTVDLTQLPPLMDPAYTADGTLVPLAAQQASRTYEVARVEALGRDRERIVAALDALLPVKSIPVLPPAAGTTPCASATPPPSAATVPFQTELGDTLGRMIDLYSDADLTLPTVTRALGQSLDDIKADPDVQSALARLDAREGYRPLPIALGAVKSILAYPRLVDLSRTLVAPLLSEPGQPEGPEAQAFDALLRVGYQELRTPDDGAPTGDLTITQDPMVPGRAILSRPRGWAEALRDTLSYVSGTGSAGAAPAYMVQRDSRGYASVPLVNGAVPAPFVDISGPNGGPDGLPDVDALGQFITSDHSIPASPFFTPEGQDGTRDPYGRAQGAAAGQLLYGYLDLNQTALASVVHDARPFFQPGVPAAKETAMDALAALQVLAGSRDTDPVASRVYPPDPYAVNDWKVGHTSAPPAGLGTTPVSLSYRGFHAADSPIVDLVYALGQVLGAPEMDDLLALSEQLTGSHPNDLANIMGLALEMRSIAANHPEAQLPDASTFWDDVLVRLQPVAHEPGLLEDMLRAFADPKTLPLEGVLETFLTMRDDVSYDTNNLNGPSIDLDTHAAPPDFKVPVDRTQPDTGLNRSEMQKFLALLHDTNGLSICTKDGAIVHISGLGSVLPIAGAASFNYPADSPTATAPNLISGLMCGLFGSTAPAHLDKCAVFGYQNVMSLLLDVLLGKALLQVNDPCLNTLMLSSFVKGLGDGTTYGGANKFLQAISGVNGFSLQPNLRGFARLLYFETPYPGLPTDANGATTNLLTSNFLADTIDPIPSMVCDETPFTTSTGQVYPLRTCKTVNDTLRARDPNALFPVDELGFVPALQPLAMAFDKHKKPLLFADLFDVLHLHWGSKAQPATVCDPTLPRSNARWCSQDGLVSYEPLLTEILQNGVFGRIQSLLSDLAGMTVQHCTATDPQSGLCTAMTKYDGIHVVAEAMSLLIDPARTPGLVDRKGSAFATRNDGQQTDPLSAMDLLVQSFKNMDDAYASFASAHPSDTTRRAQWLTARSTFVDTFLSVNGKGANASFANPTLIGMMPKVVGVLREQIAAHCQGSGVTCSWAQQDIVSNMTTSIEGPTFAAVADLLDAMRVNAGMRAEIEQLVWYLLGTVADGGADVTATLAALLDMTQVLPDQANMPAFERVLARAVAPPILDESGKVARRSLGDAAMRSLTKIFAQDIVGTGATACVRERDPNHVIPALLGNLVTQMGSDQLTPLAVLMDAIADVNRASPSTTTKLGGTDYGNIANEMSEFCLDQTRGLEQFYAVIHEITGGT